MMEHAQVREYSKDVLLIFVGYASDAKQEAQAIFTLKGQLKDFLDHMNKFNHREDSTAKKFKIIEFFDWEIDADISVGGQNTKITPIIERANIHIFVFRSRVGEVTWEELIQVKNSEWNQKKILAFFPDQVPQGLDFMDEKVSDDWSDLLKKRKILTQDWGEDKSFSITTTLYSDQKNLEEMALKILKDNICILEKPDKKDVNPVLPSTTVVNNTLFMDELAGRMDYDPKLVDDYRSKLREEIKSRTKNMDNFEFLKSEGFIRDNSLSVLGLLLFTDYAISIVPSAKINCVLYHGDTKDEDRRKHECRGNLLRQLDEAFEFITLHTDRKEKPLGDGFETTTVFKFPQTTVREVIANAVCHRDYKAQERQTHVRIFGNYMEIVSPGRWFTKELKENEPIGLSELVYEPVSRNKSLSNALSSISILESEGSGIPTSIKECKKFNSPEPIVIQKDGFVAVRIFPLRDWDNIDVRKIIDRSKGTSKRKIFISYSHRDTVWKDRLMDHLKVLEPSVDCLLWDDRDIKIGEDWFPAIKKAINEAQIVVMMISVDFLTSQFIRNEEIPTILERQRKEGIPIIPLIIRPCAWTSVGWLSTIQLWPKDGIPLSSLAKPNVETELANLVQLIHQELKNSTIITPMSLLDGDKLSLSRLPITSERLFGREKELVMLDNAWQDNQTSIVAIVAWGGVGKTALVNQWLNQMARDHYRGAEKIFGWSFYSQGATEGKQVSADEFFIETLLWFGDQDPQAGSAVDKGRRLARLLRQHKFLLILDGLEPLQYPPGEVQGLDGKLKDQGLAALLKELAMGGSGKGGLCVITTREPITDLKQRLNYGHQEILLEHLSTEAGVELLKSLGVTMGAPLDLQQAVTEYKGHALALTLLGLYIKRVFAGDVRRRDKIPRLEKERQKGFHAKRVIAAYETWFGESVERDILFLLGLFDCPVAQEVIDELLKEPMIPGVTDRLVGIVPEEWQYALSHLREARLLGAEEGHKTGTLDCHPLVREHFGAKLCETNPDGWQKAHLRLYHYFKNLPKKELPDTLVELEPLFAAVAHGCKAGLHQEVLVEVYWKRIRRGNEGYLVNKLGAFGSDLAALSFFFAHPWSQPVAGLMEAYKAVVLGWAAFGLRAMGRLQEAIQPMKAGLELSIQQEAWQGAARDASNLSELLLTLGDVPGAVAMARQSVAHADRSGDAFQMESDRTALADALHVSGAKTEAEKWFREAEAKQKQRLPQFSFLTSLSGYRFCDLLLENQSPGQANEVITRAEKGLEIAKRNNWILDMALDTLTLGRGWMKLCSLDKAKPFLEEAVAGLREAGQQDDLPRGLLARAQYYRLTHEYAKAHDDLNEVRDIAELGGMKLHLCDYYLEKKELCLAEGLEEEAEENEKKAAELIRETGYGRKKRVF